MVTCSIVGEGALSGTPVLQGTSPVGRSQNFALTEFSEARYPQATPKQQQKSLIWGMCREDEEMGRTGIIQSQLQVFELAREHFGLNKKKGAA